MEDTAFIVFAVIAIAVVIAIVIFANGAREKKIHEKVESMGGEVSSIERRNFFSGIGPFTIVGKNRVIYRVVYKVDGQTREIWVRFGGLFGPEWRE